MSLCAFSGAKPCMTSMELLQYLRSLSVDFIMQTLTPADIFRPVVDDKIVTAHSIENYSNPYLDSIPLIVGCNNCEGALMANIFCSFSLPEAAICTNVLTIMATMGFDPKQSDIPAIVEAYKKEYIKGETEEAMLKGLVELMGDFVFVRPTLEAAQKHSGEAMVHVSVSMDR